MGMVVSSKNDVLGVKRKMFPLVGKMFPSVFPDVLTLSYDVLDINALGNTHACVTEYNLQVHVFPDIPDFP